MPEENRSKLTRDEWLSLFRRYCTNKGETVRGLCEEAGINSATFYKRLYRFKLWCSTGTVAPVLDIEEAIRMAEKAIATRKRNTKGIETKRRLAAARETTNPYRRN